MLFEADKISATPIGYEYNGYGMTLEEARWACFFDACGAEWKYWTELMDRAITLDFNYAKGYYKGRAKYIPTFYLPSVDGRTGYTDSLYVDVIPNNYRDTNCKEYGPQIYGQAFNKFNHSKESEEAGILAVTTFPTIDWAKYSNESAEEILHYRLYWDYLNCRNSICDSTKSGDNAILGYSDKIYELNFVTIDNNFEAVYLAINKNERFALMTWDDPGNRFLDDADAERTVMAYQYANQYNFKLALNEYKIVPITDIPII